MSRRRAQSGKRTCRKPANANAASLRGTVADYVREERGKWRDEKKFFRRLPSLQAAVEWAALCKRPDGKRYSHQTRIPLAALRMARRRLVGASSEIARCRTFEALHN